MASGCIWAQPDARIQDLKHYSEVFGEERNFRVFTPPAYDTSAPERYPVIYFFHGWSERHNKPPRGGAGYDSGTDYGGDNISRFVGANKVIVVKWDGYNPRSPGEEYPRPYNISPVETYRQFALYFPELMAHIDANLRTIADRDHRATAGLSMGGFMSFWIAGKYPHLVGSASNFMGSSEFYVGPNGFPSEYRHTELYRNYEGVRTRLVTGSRDFIRWYHRRMNAVWKNVRPHHETEEFAHEHGTPGMARTLGFHMKAFAEPLARPSLWHHSDVYPTFEVWGYSVSTDRQVPGFTTLENVSKAGFRSSVREWLPAGRLLPATAVRISTDAVYKPDTHYRVTDVNVSTGEVKQIVSASNHLGRLQITLDGALHEIGISEAGEPIVALSGYRVAGTAWVTNGATAILRFTVLNKGAAPAQGIHGTVTSNSPGVRVRSGRFSISRLLAGAAAETEDITIELDPQEREMVQLSVVLKGLAYPLEFPVYPKRDVTLAPVILDGQKATVWERAIHRVETVLGSGNGDGKAQPGEQIVLAVPDGEAMRPVEVLAADPCIDTSERVSDPWGGYDNVGATAKFTVLQLSSTCSTEGQVSVFVQHQLPSKPEHVLKQAVFSFNIRGSDKMPPQTKSIRVAHGKRLEVVLRDGGRVKTASAQLEADGVKLAFTLNDEGRSGDITPGDGVFTGLAPNPRPGRYRVRIESEDEFGNMGTHVAAEFHEFTLPPPTPVGVR
jgi:hypothetical protein